MRIPSPKSTAYVLIAVLLLAALGASAQILSPIYTFQNTNDNKPTDSELMLAGNTLYGTMFGAIYNGGGKGANDTQTGGLFKVNTDGSGFTNFYLFSPVDHNSLTNTDGANSRSQLVLVGNTLYGTTEAGGFHANGILFAINTDGTGFTNLHNFGANAENSGGFETNADGASPSSGLLLSGNTLYGTTGSGGQLGGGTVFAINTDGTGYTNLYNFTAFVGASDTNGDGAGGKSTLILIGNMLYGTAQRGGAAGNGTVFGINTDSTGFTNLHNFSALVRMTTPPYYYTNSDGAGPYGALVLSAGKLYGTTWEGGTNTISTSTSAGGTIFALNPDGTGFTTLHNCGSDTGAFSMTGLALSGNSLYGTGIDGAFGQGAVFALNTDGTGFADIESFVLPGYNSAANIYTNLAGSVPRGNLIFSGNNLYGVTGAGGTNGNGTIFSLDLAHAPPPIQFTATPSNGLTRLAVQFNAPAVDANGNAILSWNWNFGDGATSTSTIQNPSHTYTNAATFTPTLTCINDYGNPVVASGPAVLVNPLPPIQFAATPVTGFPPIAVHFMSPSEDAGSNFISTWYWNFGDGSTSTAQNPTHSYTNAGTFFPTLVCTNLNRDAIVGVGPSIVVQNSLIQNGSFEAGTFTNWTHTGFSNAATRVTTSATFVHSGKYGAELTAPGLAGVFGYLSQTFPTTPGGSYQVSLWLDNTVAVTPNDFQIIWNGAVVLDATNIGDVGWTNIQVNVTAAATNSTLTLGYLTDSVYFGLDDIGVAATSSTNAPAAGPSISAITITGANIVLNSPDGVTTQTYSVLMSTNLADPINKWTPVASSTPTAPGNFTITLTNAVNPTTPQRYYILQTQ